MTLNNYMIMIKSIVIFLYIKLIITANCTNTTIIAS